MVERWKRALGTIGKIAYLIVVIPLVLWCIGFVFSLGVTSYSYALIGSWEHNIEIAGTSSLGTRYALIQISDNDRQSNVILERDELDRVLTIWNAAKARQSQHWIKIGDFKESDLVNPARLTISAGQGVRFAVVDAGVCARYDLAPRDFEPLEQALRRARRHFTDDDADRGVKAKTLTWRKAFDTTNGALRAQIPAGAWPNCQ